MSAKAPPYPGPTPNYGGDQYIPPTEHLVPDTKSPYDYGRFRPKKTINDPIFLIFFILQVSAVQL
jgi:hypothetical protein